MASPSSVPVDLLDPWHRIAEQDYVPQLLQSHRLSEDQRTRIHQRARRWIQQMRKDQKHQGMVGHFMGQFPLSTPEGILLMCLAEALVRIPDTETQNALLQDKLSQGDFLSYLSNVVPWKVNLGIRGLAWGSKLLQGTASTSFLKKGLQRLSLPIIRKMAQQAMTLLTKKFVLGSTIEQALALAPKNHAQGYSHSYDMLGEAALTQEDVDRYFKAYQHGIQALARASKTSKAQNSSSRKDSISVKLSALHPRYSFAQQERVLAELTPRLLDLCRAAAAADIALTIDAEETERLEISLQLFSLLAHHSDLKHWQGLGLAVQAYQKRAVKVMDYVLDLAKASSKRLNIRLVKGAYWDSEIKRCQELGLSDYPVFTRKEATDVSYMVCAEKMLAHRDLIYPQFATHNALTIATILELAPETQTYEFQKLQGMGDELYQPLVNLSQEGLSCRIYAPVGNPRELLPYMVRRLLENGANTSFVHQSADLNTPIEKLLVFPQDALKAYASLSHSKIPLPAHLYGSTRENAAGLDLFNPEAVKRLQQDLQKFTFWKATPLSSKPSSLGTSRPILNPADQTSVIGEVEEASVEDALAALTIAESAFETWRQTSASRRATYLRRLADLLQEHQTEMIALCVREGGKTLPDALAEVREGIDFCRYYADRGEIDFKKTLLPGPTGERNTLLLEGRGVFVCISPWNFPLAIFIGQVVAALMAGNTVIAKPARQTPLVAYRLCELLYQAGIPRDVLHFLPGSGSLLGTILLQDPRVSGVAFTGSTETAWSINRLLASRNCAIAPLIAETGGQNAMIVDSSALPEQVVQDVMSSAFQSAGQRCSALRVLFLQEEIAPRVLEILKGAMKELSIGNPDLLTTDVGPVIDKNAFDTLQAHREKFKAAGYLVHECVLKQQRGGYYIPPTVFELPSLDLLDQEMFGPILHVLRFKSQNLDQVITQINQLKFGLTFGLHTRLDRRIAQITRRLQAGNIYVNRNTIGAVVGVQPFGGRGLSGTGPKAGGPHYLHRFATEKTISTNLTSQGGNTTLMTLTETY